MFSIIETNRLYLRPMTAYDLDDLFKLYSDPLIMKSIGNGQPKSYIETQQELARMIKAFHHDKLSLHAVINKEDDCFIGQAGLWKSTLDTTKELEISCMLTQNFQNKGFGTEIAIALLDYALTNTAYPYFICFIPPDNPASAITAKKIGMTFWKKRLLSGINIDVYKINRS